VVNIKRPKRNFSVAVLTRVLVTVWSKDDLIFVPKRCRLQFTFIFRVYYWAGPGLGAFITGSLRYGVSSRQAQLAGS
jgi:hypothetical protein